MLVAAVTIANLCLLPALDPGIGAVDAQAATTPLVITTPTLPPTPLPLATPTSMPEMGIFSHASDYRTYRVQPGDTLLSVALEVGIDLEDAYCMVRPDFSWNQPLVIGDELSVPAPGAICHAVEEGETLGSISADYSMPAQEIVAEPWNELANAPGGPVALVPGHHLRIPPPAEMGALEADGDHMVDSAAVLPLLLSQAVNADVASIMAVGATFAQGEAPPVGSPSPLTMAPVPKDWPFGSGHFAWPLAGWLTQGYKDAHRAIDVAAPAGAVVTSADRGVVIRAGWNSQGYGRFVIIDHNIDYITLYAHLSEVLVEEGEVVASGQAIGRVGSTGNSTGPHLHFEIRDFGRRIDPLRHLLR